MQEFIDHLLEGLDLDRKLTDEEMSRMIRFVLAFEEEAFQLYTHLMTSTDNCKISAVFKHLADEKRFQVAQLIRLLGELNSAAKKLLH
jgi:rubrerythrin